MYVDGILARSFPQARFGKDCAGELVIGTSPVGKSNWSGQLKGLALYQQELTPTEILQHYRTWTRASGALRKRTRYRGIPVQGTCREHRSQRHPSWNRLVYSKALLTPAPAVPGTIPERVQTGTGILERYPYKHRWLHSSELLFLCLLVICTTDETS
jgi:hypothetical protein